MGIFRSTTLTMGLVLVVVVGSSAVVLELGLHGILVSAPIVLGVMLGIVFERDWNHKLRVSGMHRR